MAEFAAKYPWFIESLLYIFLAALVVLLVWGVMKIIGEDLKQFVEYLIEERDEYKNRRPTIGAMNWRCVRLLSLFGVIVIVGSGFAEVVSFIEKYTGKEQAKSLQESISVMNLFYVLAVVVVISVLSVLASKKQS